MLSFWCYSVAYATLSTMEVWFPLQDVLRFHGVTPGNMSRSRMTAKAKNGQTKAVRAANLRERGEVWALVAQNARTCARKTRLVREFSAAWGKWGTNRRERAGHAAKTHLTAVSRSRCCCLAFYSGKFTSVLHFVVYSTVVLVACQLSCFCCVRAHSLATLSSQSLIHLFTRSPCRLL